MNKHQKIQVLPPHEALKIAAGEVIERPAHVVKELVENALDAGATTIDVHIKKVGKELIRIVDNGCGMSSADANLCFLPHATSKISHLDDLENIQSFGFRGEALASIAAISKVTLITKSEHAAIDDLATQLVYGQSMLQSQSEVVAPQGTDISIADLFFNTPVRKKFLKQDETEWNATQQIVHAFCLSYSHIHFRLYHDNKLVLNAPPVQTAKERASQLWDYDCSQNLIPLTTSDENTQTQSYPFTITGFISHHNFWRYGRQQMHFFVNNRWVKNAELGKGLLKGYLNVLPPDRFPIALIFITISPQSIDVNVHPKKEEVKFVRPGVVQMALATMVKKTLEQHLSTKLGNVQTQTGAPLAYTQQHSPLAPTRPSFQDTFHMPEPYVFPNAAQIAGRQFIQTPPNSPSKLHEDELEAIFSGKPEITSFIPPEQQVQMPLTHPEAGDTSTILGQLFNTYIMLEKSDEIVFVDQHAAHERVLFEKFQKNFELQHGTTLLFPEVLTFSPQTIIDLMLNKTFFDQQGIDLDILGEQQIVIRSAPPHIKGSSLKELITDAILFIQEHHALDRSLFGKEFNLHLHCQMACKSAVKAGDVLTQQQIKQLIDDLQNTENRFICAHGRPTTWSISKAEFEKQFKRC